MDQLKKVSGIKNNPDPITTTFPYRVDAQGRIVGTEGAGAAVVARVQQSSALYPLAREGGD